jgi:hypothetical protein
MVLDSLKDRMGGRDQLHPMQIARNSLFTAREKLELLQDLKATVTGAQDNDEGLGFTAEEVDEAIAHVRRGVADGVGTQTVVGGDY